ncbi:hypothetical protein ANN_08513 [Periplaneta americana]|uniref:Nuclease HARBI1 n=1 Tax=Periplaneta americana TaxID=6978 RepID=A0ABQ8T397_PERAM|nr:hypothetical protein ANN_08513 [Periplaneta americana]
MENMCEFLIFENYENVGAGAGSSSSSSEIAMHWDVNGTKISETVIQTPSGSDTVVEVTSGENETERAVEENVGESRKVERNVKRGSVKRKISVLEQIRQDRLGYQMRRLEQEDRKIESLEKEVLIFLWYICHQTSGFYDVAIRFDIAISSLHRVIIRVAIFLSNLAPQIITWPTENEKSVSAKYFRMNEFPNVIGAIDGCHIKTDKTNNDPDSYINRKGFYSVQKEESDIGTMTQKLNVGHTAKQPQRRKYKNLNFRLQTLALAMMSTMTDEYNDQGQRAKDPPRKFNSFQGDVKNNSNQLLAFMLEVGHEEISRKIKAADFLADETSGVSSKFQIAPSWFDVNKRIVKAFSDMGKGYGALEIFSVSLNMRSMFHSSYDNLLLRVRQSAVSSASSLQKQDKRCNAHIGYVLFLEKHYPYVLFLEKHYPKTYLQVKSGTDPKNVKCIVKCEYYLRYYQEHFNYPFGRPRTDVCGFCEEYRVKISTETNRVLRKRLQNDLKLHKSKAKKFQPSMKEATQYLQNNENAEAICFDFEQNIPFPNLAIFGAFYKRQLWLHNFALQI